MYEAGEIGFGCIRPGELVHMKRDARFLSNLVPFPRYDTCNTKNTKRLQRMDVGVKCELGSTSAWEVM